MKKLFVIILLALFICSPAYAITVPMDDIRELQSKVELLEIEVSNLQTESRSCRIELGYTNDRISSLEGVVKSFQESVLSLQKMVINFVRLLISKIK